jgi:hypothetical protein
MVPMYGQIAKATIDATLDVFVQPETADRLATFARNYYDALIAKGFTKDEAIVIVARFGFPGAPMGK